ncbi:MAG: Ig-like domain-containing protein, partial [Candidatus Margulisiibacteriota bacterium]
MIKKYLILPLLILTILIGLGLAGQAISPVTPANSVVNPVTGTLYYVENDATPRVLIRSGSTWADLTSISLPATSKCHGLAVSNDGTKLFVSVGLGAASEVRTYPLNGSGIPSGGSTDMSGDIWGSGSLPAGMAFASNNRLFVVDNGAGRLWVYNTSTNAMVKLVTSGISGQTGLFSVAVTPADGFGAYKIFISQKVNTGKIYVYDYAPAGDTVTYLTTISTGLTYPTYLKVSANKLYVAVNGSDGIDVKVYDISNSSPYLTLHGSVENPDVNASYGWTAFDITPGGGQLVYKRAQNSSETSNKIYSILTNDISGTVQAEEVDAGASSYMADGLAISSAGTGAALTYSPTGAYTYTEHISPVINTWPTIVQESLKQYRLDGVTEIADEGTTNENQIIVKFQVNDATPTGTLIPTVAHRPVGGSWTEEIMASQTPGATVSLTIPVSGTFTNGNYEWRVSVSDGDLPPMTVWYVFGSDNGDTDFIVDTTNDPPVAFGKTLPADGNDECCDANLQWTASSDPDVLDTLTYSVFVYNPGDYVTPAYTQTGITGTSHSVTSGLVVGNTYEWNVSVTDGTNTVWANGNETARWSFNYIASIINPGAPFITSTTPLNAATDVNIDAAVTITFNESIQSGTFTYTVAPAVTGTSVSWNPTHTVATIAHDDFAASTPYTITVTNADDVDESLSMTGDNDFAFTTGTGSG